AVGRDGGRAEALHVHHVLEGHGVLGLCRLGWTEWSGYEDECKRKEEFVYAHDFPDARRCCSPRSQRRDLGHPACSRRRSLQRWARFGCERRFGESEFRSLIYAACSSRMMAAPRGSWLVAEMRPLFSRRMVAQRLRPSPAVSPTACAG